MTTTARRVTYRVTYLRHGVPGAVEFECEADARMFVEWGFQGAAFVRPQVKECHA